MQLFCLLSSFLLLLSNLIIDLLHHLSVPIKFAAGKLSSIWEKFTFLEELLVAVYDGLDLDRWETVELFAYLLHFPGEIFEILMGFSVATLKICQRFTLSQFLFWFLLVSIVIFKELKAFLEEIVEFLCLKVHFLLHYSYMFLIFLLVTCNLTWTDHSNFSLKFSLQRIMLSQSWIKICQRLFNKNIVKFISFSQNSWFFITKLHEKGSP